MTRTYNSKYVYNLPKSTNILGLEETEYDHDESVVKKFKNYRSEEGWQETWPIWKENYIPLGKKQRQEFMSTEKFIEKFRSES